MKGTAKLKAAPSATRFPSEVGQHLRLLRTDDQRPRLEVPLSRKDPLEEPVLHFCGLCGNRIEGQSQAEERFSGHNQSTQVWQYHELCWRQLLRMRRTDNGFSGEKRVNPEIRYHATVTHIEGLASSLSDTLAAFQG